MDPELLGRPIVAFDLETVPDPELGRRLHGFAGRDGEVVVQMLERRREETDQRTDFHALPFHRVVMVSFAWLDLEAGAFRLESPGGSSREELDHLEGFYRSVLRPEPPRLLSWNGRGFDLPVLRYRSMVHGLAVPEFYAVGRERGRGGYWDRWGRDHVDLMDVLSGAGASSRVRLDDWSRILGLPGKTVMEGSEVHRHVTGGDLERVRTYCELDVVGTLLVYLVWLGHLGVLESGRLDQLVAAIRTELVADRRSEVASYGRDLGSWSAGGRRLDLPSVPRE